MSQFVGRFSLTNNTPLTVSLPPTGMSAVVISNDSQFSVFASLNGTALNKTIPAGIADSMTIPNNSFNGSLILVPTQQLSIQNSPANFVEVTVYGRGEQVPGIYPVSLNRLSNSGNDLGVQGGLRARSTNTLNGGSFLVTGSATQTPFLKSLVITVTKGGAAASGELIITGFDPLIVDGAELIYELTCSTGAAMPPIHDTFASPLPGTQGNGLTITGPGALSTATVAIALTYYLS